jgi:hypothetical protein
MRAISLGLPRRHIFTRKDDMRSGENLHPLHAYFLGNCKYAAINVGIRRQRINPLLICALSVSNIKINIGIHTVTVLENKYLIIGSKLFFKIF